MPKNELMVSERQLEAIRLLARGNTMDQVAELMGIQRRTVKYYLDRVRLQLDSIPSRELPQALHERGYEIYPQ